MKGTQADRAYERIKRGILRGEFPEGTFLSEASVTAKLGLGRTPFREACNRLHNEQLLAVVPRRGFLVPELSFRAVRDLVETRLVLEGVAAELAAMRSEPGDLKRLEETHRQLTALAKQPRRIDELVETNREFHLEIARLAQNQELESLLRGVLERSTRLVYWAARSSIGLERDVEELLKPIIAAIRRRDPKAAHEAVVNDITRGQLNALGREMWASAGSTPAVLIERSQKKK